MVLDLARLNAVGRVARKCLLGIISLEGTRLLTEIAISNLCTRGLKIRARVTSVSPVLWNVRLMAHACKIVCKTLPHVLDGVDFAVLHPLVVLIPRIQPEGEPVRLHVTCDFVVEF